MPDREVTLERFTEVKSYIGENGGEFKGYLNHDPMDYMDGQVFLWKDEPIMLYGTHPNSDHYRVLCSVLQEVELLKAGINLEEDPTALQEQSELRREQR